MITINMIRKAYRIGLIQIGTDPTGNDTVCQIGDNYFYIGGATERYTPDKYISIIPEQEIVKEIFEALEEIQSEFPAEYEYYMHLLKRNLIRGHWV